MIEKTDIDKRFSHLDAIGRKRIFSLSRRADHLASRIANSGHMNLDYDKMELGALNWAIKYIEGKFW